MISALFRRTAASAVMALAIAWLPGIAAAQAQQEGAQPGAAQQPSQPAPGGQPAAPQQQGQAPAQENWVVVCDPPAEGADKRCTLLQNLAVRSGETQQRLLTVLVQKQPDSESMMLLLSLPHGLFLPAGAQIQIDEGEPSKIVIQTSDATGSYAGTELTPELLDALRRGQVLNVSMMSANQRGITVPVTLVGFSKGYAELSQALR